MRLQILDDKDGKPHDFFAWSPVKIRGEWVWLEHCWRRWIPPCPPNAIPAFEGDITGYWIYGIKGVHK